MGLALSSPALHALYVHFAQRYRVTLVPGGGSQDRLPAPTAAEVLERMETRMSLKDAEIALVVREHSSNLSVFLSWNAKHFVGKLAVPPLTPREWLRSKPRRGSAAEARHGLPRGRR